MKHTLAGFFTWKLVYDTKMYHTLNIQRSDLDAANSSFRAFTSPYRTFNLIPHHNHRHRPSKRQEHHN